MIKVDRLFPFYSSRCFLKEIRNIFSVFLSSYRITRESLKKLEKAVETVQHFLFSQTSTRVSIKQLGYELEISITHRNQERIV